MGLVNTVVPWWSPVDNTNFFGVSSTGAQNVTTGCKFSVSRPLVMTGVRFYWKSVGGARQIRVRVYMNSASQRDVLVNVNASGIYTGTFASPITLDPYQGYSCTCYETTGVNYTYVDAIAGSGPNGAAPVVTFFQFNAYCIIRTIQISAAGDTVPGAINGNLMFPIEPILSPYNLIDGAVI